MIMSQKNDLSESETGYIVDPIALAPDRPRRSCGSSPKDVVLTSADVLDYTLAHMNSSHVETPIYSITEGKRRSTVLHIIYDRIPPASTHNSHRSCDCTDLIEPLLSSRPTVGLLLSLRAPVCGAFPARRRRHNPCTPRFRSPGL
jgi:hypothetical protein